MFNFRVRFRSFLGFVFVVILVGSLFISSASLASPNQCVLAPKDSWRNKFPIGFVTGTFPTTNYFEGGCPEFGLFGFTYKVCAVGTLLDLLKNVVLIKFIITSLQNL